MENENQLMDINGDGITKIILWMYNIHNIWREAMVADWFHTPIMSVRITLPHPLTRPNASINNEGSAREDGFTVNYHWRHRPNRRATICGLSFVIAL